MTSTIERRLQAIEKVMHKPAERVPLFGNLFTYAEIRRALTAAQGTTINPVDYDATEGTPCDSEAKNPARMAAADPKEICPISQPNQT